MKIKYTKEVLSNGLRVIHHYDSTTPLAVINVLYDVGARDENPNLTGFAHLFEHLMFGGSKNIPLYDPPLQKAGGENNAFTANDITNYYLTISKPNIETGLWLESDRMLDLDFSEKLLEVQKKVVIEEFKQRYLNQPYGDIWLLLRPLAYKVHPYQWDTIGKNIKHIEQAKLDDVVDFYRKFYNPPNAILSVAGDIDEDKVFPLIEKWFGGINKPHNYVRQLPQEPLQTESRRLVVERNVPANCILIAFPMVERLHKDYYAYELLMDILSGGESGRLNQELVKKRQIFSSCNAFILGSNDAGLLVFRGNVLPDVDIKEAEKAIWEQIDLLKVQGVKDNEMTKILNQTESSLAFSHVDILEKAINLAFFELLGNAALLDDELDKYSCVTKEDIKRIALETFTENKSSTLVYLAKNK